MFFFNKIGENDRKKILRIGEGDNKHKKEKKELKKILEKQKLDRQGETN